jgi:universal stress protein F
MYKNILVPLAPDHQAVASGSLGVARALLAPGGHIRVLTVIEPIPAHVAQYLPADQHKKVLRDVEAELKAEFGSAKDVSVMALIGHPAQAILETASDGAFDCVIIASHRPGLQDYFLGSTAGRVVRHAQCAVHVTR